jgi:hypothetical protein
MGRKHPIPYHPVFIQGLHHAQGLLGDEKEYDGVFLMKGPDKGLLAGEFSGFANSLITNPLTIARFAQVMHYLKRYARHVDLLEFRRAHALSAI